MKHLRILILLLPLVPYFSSCGRHQAELVLEDVETYIQDRPDSALAVLESMDQHTIVTRAAKAKYAVLYSAALDKNYIDTTDLDIIQPAVTYYMRHGTPDEKLKALYYQGRIHSNAGNYNKAIVSYTEALPLISKTDDEKYDGMLYSAITVAYNMTYNFDECLRYSDKAYNSFINSNDIPLANWALYSRAQDYYNTQRFSAADSLYRALLSSDSLDNSLRGTIESSYAFNLTSAPMQNLHVADSLFSSAIQHAGGLNNDSHWGAYAYLLSTKGELHEAGRILRELDAANSNAFHYWASQVEKENGNIEEAYSHLYSAFSSIEPIVNQAISQSTIKAQRDFFEIQTQNASLKIKGQRLLLLLVTILSLMAILFLYLLRRRNIQIAESEKSKLLEMKELAIKQLNEEHRLYEDERDKLRADYVQMYKTQFKYFAEISEAVTLAGKYTNKSDSYKSVYDKAASMVKDINSNKAGQKRFEQKINEAMHGIMKRFREDFPGLNEKDFQFVSYVFAGFDATLIALLLKFPSVPAVYMKKSRIKKMISSNNSVNKHDYLALFE